MAKVPQRKSLPQAVPNSICSSILASVNVSFGCDAPYVVSSKVMDVGLAQHGEVLQLGLSQWWGVASNDDELGLAGTDGLEGRLVSENVLSGFHHQLYRIIRTAQSHGCHLRVHTAKRELMDSPVFFCFLEVGAVISSLAS